MKLQNVGYGFCSIEQFIPGRCIVPEWTWPGRGIFCSIPGLSRAIRDTWSPYRQLLSSMATAHSRRS